MDVRQAMTEGLLRNGPFCPLDVPDEVWQAVAKEYITEGWEPGPNYHPEYRDCRNAYLATVQFLQTKLRQMESITTAYREDQDE